MFISLKTDSLHVALKHVEHWLGDYDASQNPASSMIVSRKDGIYRLLVTADALNEQNR